MLKKKKTWDIIGALLGLVILIVGVIFAIVPPESYRANSVDRISFGADYYTEDAASAAEVAKEAVRPSVPDAGRGQKPDAAGAAVYGGICCVAWGKGKRRCDTPGEQDQTTQEKSCP